jgi:hypothetical protein
MSNFLEYAERKYRRKKEEEAADASSSANNTKEETNTKEEANTQRASRILEKTNTQMSPARNATYSWMQQVEKDTDGLTTALSKGVNGNLNNLKNITSYTNTVDSLLRTGNQALQIAKGTGDYNAVRKYYSYLQELKKGIDYYKEGNDIFKLTDAEYKVGKALDNNSTNSLEYAADSPNPLWFKNKEAQREHENYYKISDEDIEKYNNKEFELTMKFAGDNYKNTDTYKSAVNDLMKKGMTDKEAADMLDRIMNDPESIKRKKLDDKLTKFSDEEIRHYTAPDFINALSTPEGDKSYFYNQAIDEIKAKGFSEEEAEKIIYRFSEMANDVDKDINRRAGERRANRQNVLENLMDDVAGTPIKSAEGLWNIAKGTAGLIPNKNEFIAPEDDGGFATYLNAMHEETTKDMGPVGKTTYNTSKLLGDLGLLYLIGGPAVDNIEVAAKTRQIVKAGGNPWQIARGAHKLATAALFGGSAADDAYINAKNNGASEGQALTYGLAQGLSSYLVMKIGLGNLSKMTKSQLMNTMIQSSGNMMAMSTAGQLADMFEQQAILGENSTVNKTYQAYLDQGMSEENAKKKVAQDLGIQLATGALEGAVTGAILGAGAYGKGIVTGEINDSVSENPKKQTTPEDTEFFKDVNNTEELKLKRKELAKTYHPDQVNGSEEVMSQIGMEYDELIKYFESKPNTKGKLSEALNKLKNFKEKILNYRSSQATESNTEIALLQDSKLNEVVAAVDNKINEVETAIKNAPAETISERTSEVAVPETNDVIYMPPAEETINAPLQAEKTTDIINTPSQEEKISTVANTLPQDNLRAAAMEMNGVSKSEIPALKNAAMEMNGANTDLKNAAKNEVTSKSVNRLKDAPDINVGNNKTKGLKVEKTLDETAGNTPQVTETKVPDAIKLKGKEIIDSVRNGSYKPKYELGHNVATDYGKGYIQEVIRTDGETMDVIANFDNGQSEVMRFEDYDDYFALTDEGVDKLYASAAAVGYEGANLMIKEATPKLLENPSALMRYVKDFYELYNAGKRGTSFKDIYESGYELYMPEKKAMKIYKAGVTDALYELKAKKENLKVKEETEIKQKETPKAEIESKVNETKQLRDSEVDLRKSDYYKSREIPADKVVDRALNKHHKAEIEAVKQISKVTGIDIKFYESTIDKNGKFIGANGFFDKKTNTIWLDINAGRKNAETINTAIMKTLSHELTHFCKDNGGTFFKNYSDSVVKVLEEITGKNRETLIEEKMEKLGVDYSTAEEEIVADASEMMLEHFDRFEDIAKENPTLWEKIKDHIKEFINKIKDAIRKAYEGLEPTSEEAITLRKAEKYAEEIQNGFDNMLVESVKKFKDSEKTDTGVVFKKRTGSKSKYKKLQFPDKYAELTSENRNKLFSDLANEMYGKSFYVNENGKNIEIKIANRNDTYRKNGKKRSVVFELYKKNNNNRIKFIALNNLDEVIKNSVLVGKEKGGKHNWLDANGWEYRMAYVNKVKCILNIAISDKGVRYLYDITFNDNKKSEQVGNPVKKRESPVQAHSSRQEYIKNSKKSREKYKKTRFSMRNDVEETDKFVATHNLGIDNLKEMLKLGGFPMPSIAVTKSKVGNKGFGGVSVVFRKNTIDPAANSNNKLYSGDAWTPVFPNTEWKLNEKGVKKLADKLDTSSRYLEQFIEKPDRAVEKLKEERMTKEAFLKEQNVTIEKKKMNKPYSSDSMKKIEDVVRKKQYTIDKIVNSDEIQEELAQLLRPIDKDSRQFLIKWHNDIKEDLKRLNEADEFDKPLLRMKEDIESMLSGKREQVFDSESYDNDVNTYLKEHDEEYTKYITDALEGVYEDKYLVKPGVEPYYSDGSRKSFDQLHLPYNIENIVSIMKGQDKGKGGGVLWGGASSLKGAGTKEFGTVEEMKQNAGKIKETSDEEIREVYREMNDRIDNIINTTLETNGRDSSSWMAKDGFAEIMTEAFAKKRFTENAIRNYFKKEMGLEVTHEIFEEMKSLKNDLEAIPVKYFEAKPERAVGLDEVAYVVIPDTTPTKDKEEIASYGISYKEYKEGDEESRIAAVNSDPEVMFSMRNVSEESYEELLEENENLKKQVAALEKQFKVTNGFSPKESDIRTVGNKIIKAYSSDYPINDFMENMKQIVDYTAKNKSANYGLVMEAMMKIAGEIANQSTYKDSSLYDQYSNLRKSMRSTTIRLTKKQIEEVEYKYGSFNDFRKANFGKLKFSDKKGIYLDEYWKENAQLYPDMFMEDVNEGDMVNELVGIYDDIRQPVLIKGSEMDMKYATTEIAQDIFKEYFDLPSVQTFADARIHELNDARDEYRQLVNEQRQEFNDKYNKKVYRDKIKRVRNNIAQKVTVKKSVPLDMVDKVIDVCNEIYLGGVNVAAVGRKTAAELNSKLDIPKDKAKKISDMCETLFFDNPNESVGRTEDRLIKWLSEGEFKGLQIRDIADICHDNFFAMAATNKVEKGLHSRLKNLQQTYAKYEKLPETEYEWKSEYNERLNSKLEEIVEITQDKAINSLNAYELDKVYQALQEVAHIIVNADRQIGEEENRKNQEIAREIVTEVKNSNTRKSKLSRYVNTYNDKLVLNSTRYMRAITNWNPESPLYNKVFKPVFEAQRVKDMNVMKMKKPFDKLVDDKKNFDLYTGRDKKGIIKNVLTDIKGNPVDMSLDQICTLLMTWERKRGEAHAEVGGIKIDDIYLLNKGKKRKAYDEGAVIPRLNQQTIEHLKKIVSDYSKEWMKKGHILLNEVTTDMINETSIQSRGVPIATAKNYFPLKVVGNYIKNESPAMKHDATIEGMGMLKETKSGAKQMLYIKPLTSIVDETIENVARYNAFTIPLRNARKLMNYIFYDENESVQNAIEEQYGSFAKEKMVRILDEIETGKNLLKPSNSEEWGKLYSNFVAAALNTNLSVSIKQFASYPTAQAYIKGKYLMRALLHPVDYDEIDEYTGAHYKRRQGLSHIELENIRKSSKLQNVFDKLPTVLNGRKWITMMDCFTTSKLFYAAKLQIEAKGKYKEGSKEFKKAVADLYNKVLEETQPMYDVQYRADVQKKPGWEVIAMFKTQPLQTYGMLYDATGEYEFAKSKAKQDREYKKSEEYKQAKKRMYFARKAFLNSSILFTALTAFANMVMKKDSQWRDKETGEVDLIKTVPIHLLENYIGNLFPILGGEAFGWVTGTYNDLETPTLSMINESYHASNNLIKYVMDCKQGKKEFERSELNKKIENIAYDLSSIAGVEAKNIANIIKAGIYWVGYATDNKQIMNSYGYQYKDAQLYNQLYNAIVEGDEEKQNSLQQYFIDEGKSSKDIDNKLKQMYAENDPRVLDAAEAYNSGDFSEYENLIEEMTETGFKKDIIVAAVSYMAKKIETKEEEEPETEYDTTDNEKPLYKQADLYRAMKEGNKESFELVKKEILATGKEEKDIESAAKQSIKKEWKDGITTMAQAKKYMKEFFGYSDSEAYGMESEWNDKKTYEDLGEAAKSGSQENMKYYMELLYDNGNGKDVDTIKKGINGEVKGNLVYNYYSGGDTSTIYNSLMYAADYMGLDKEKYNESINEWIYGGSEYGDLMEYVASGNLKSAKNEILYLNADKNKKVSTIEGKIKSVFKPVYIYMAENNKNTETLKNTIVELATYMGIPDYDKEIESW